MFLFLTAPCGCARAGWGPLSDSSDKKAESYYQFMRACYEEISNNLDTALKHMKAASDLDAGSYYLKLETARLLSLNGDNEMAMKYANEAILLKPKELKPYFMAAMVAARSGAWDQAERYYQDVMRLDPKNIDAMMMLGALYMETGREDQAEAVYKRMTTADPGYLSYYHLGHFYSEAGRDKEAAAALDVSLKKNPEFINTHLELARIYEKTGNLKGMEKAYRSLIKLLPDENEPRIRLAFLLLDSGRKAEADKLLKEAAAHAADPAEIGLRVGMFYMDQGSYAEAAEAFETAMTAGGDDRARYLLASALLRRSDADKQKKAAAGLRAKAKKTLGEITPDSDFYVDARLLMAAAVENKDNAKRLDESLRIVAEAVKAKPDNPRLRVAEAMIVDEQGDSRKARDLLLKAVGDFPANSEIRYWQGVIEDKLGDKTAAIAALRAALDLDPDHPDALNNLAYTWAERQENLDEALAMALKANSLKPDSGPILDTVAWIYFHLGQNEKAMEYLELAVPLTNNDPVVLDHLGDVLLKLGRKKEALKAYRQALDNGFTDKETLNEKIKKLGQ